MPERAPPLRMTAAEYLAWEREQPEKHEFHLGEVFAMAGGSPRHNVLASACAAELRTAHRGGPCGVLSSDQQISTTSRKRYVYADAVVVCGPFEHETGASDVLTNPSVVVEVLSSSTESFNTEAYDRGEKWQAYQRLGSLRDYLLVSQREARVEHYQRTEGGWRYAALGEGERIELAGGASFAVDDLYRGAFDYPGDAAPDPVDASSGD